jgi:DNA-binding CsgD family transcriptional regulator
MGNIIIPKDYACFAKADDFHSLCSPLLCHSEIDMIAYVRSYSDGSFFAFNTYIKFEEYATYDPFMHKIFSKFGIIMDFNMLDILSDNVQFPKNKGNKIRWYLTDIHQGEHWINLLQDFNLNSYFCVSEKIDNYHEGFEFASSAGKDISSFYINHYDLLEKFMLYFKEYGADLIRMGEKNKITLPTYEVEYYKMMQDIEKKITIEKNGLANLNTDFKLKKYLLNNKNIGVYITARELECLQCLSQGLTAKEAGNVLQISPRTIESHVQNIKDKLGVSFQNQMLKIFRSSSLVNL